MSEQLLRELHNRHSDAQSKYAYFLLAISAATIAFAIQRTEGATFTNSLYPVLIAILLWAYSFYCGIQHVLLLNLLVRTNRELIQLRMDEHPEQPKAQYKDQAIKTLKESFEKINDKAASYINSQLIYIGLGAFVYIAAHFLKIIENTHAT